MNEYTVLYSIVRNMIFLHVIIVQTITIFFIGKGKTNKGLNKMSNREQKIIYDRRVLKNKAHGHILMNLWGMWKELMLELAPAPTLQ